MTVVLVIGFVGLALLAFVAWWRRTCAQRDEALAGIARLGMSRERFPHRYVGETTRFGLAHDTPCRRLRNEQGGVVRVQTPDGREWNVPGRLVARRQPVEA